MKIIVQNLLFVFVLLLSACETQSDRQADMKESTTSQSAGIQAGEENSDSQAAGESIEQGVEQVAGESIETDSPTYFEEGRYIKPNTKAHIIRTLRFIEVDEHGTVKGFNLDGEVSSDGDEASCGHGDLIAPDGTEGIDNQLAELWTTLASIVGEQVDALLQNAINEGRVLMIFELEGLDNPLHDDDVTLNVYRGILRPEIGTQGLITPDQTFEFDYESPITSVAGLSIRNGELTTGAIELNIPIIILSLDIIAKVEFARIYLKINEEGEISGFFSGAMHVPTLVDDLINTDAEHEARIVSPFFIRNADMVMVDGECTYLSMGMEFTTTHAFVVRDQTKEIANNQSY